MDGREVGSFSLVFQAEGELRADFDPEVIGRGDPASIDAVSHLLARDPDLDLDKYASELAAVFDLATRIEMARHDP